MSTSDDPGWIEETRPRPDLPHIPPARAEDALQPLGCSQWGTEPTHAAHDWESDQEGWVHCPGHGPRGKWHPAPAEDPAVRGGLLLGYDQSGDKEPPQVLLQVEDRGEQIIGQHDTVWMGIDGSGRGNTVAEWLEAADRLHQLEEAVTELAPSRPDREHLRMHLATIFSQQMDLTTLATHLAQLDQLSTWIITGRPDPRPAGVDDLDGEYVAKLARTAGVSYGDAALVLGAHLALTASEARP